MNPPGRRFRTYFITGLLVLLPMIVSVALLTAIFGYVTDWLIKAIPGRYKPLDHLLLIRLAALAAFVALTAFIGMLARNVLGRRLIRIGEEVFVRTPLLSKVYMAVRQISESILSHKNTNLRQVVLVEYPRHGVYSIGFITSEGELPLQSPGKGPMVSIFIPTSPNPTSGMLIFVPRADVIPLAVSVGDGMKLVVSAGSVTADQLGALVRKASEAAPGI